MNSLIKEQLTAVTAVKLNFDDSTTNIFIPKSTKILTDSLKLGEVYRINIHDSVVHPSSNSILASNWNNNIVPEYNEYIVEIVDKLGQMIKVNGVAIENNASSFYGWLPKDSFDVISKE